jgi:hypothetical protein
MCAVCTCNLALHYYVHMQHAACYAQPFCFAWLVSGTSHTPPLHGPVDQLLCSSYCFTSLCIIWPTISFFSALSVAGLPFGLCVHTVWSVDYSILPHWLLSS